jgi:hypothetical protein
MDEAFKIKAEIEKRCEKDEYYKEHPSLGFKYGYVTAGLVHEIHRLRTIIHLKNQKDAK